MAFYVWLASSMARVSSTALPEELAGAGMGAANPGVAVTMHLARGEAGSVQVLVRPAAGEELRAVHLKASDLHAVSGRSGGAGGAGGASGGARGAGRGAILPASCIAWQQVGFVQVKPILHPHRWGARTLPPGWYGDPLLPVAACDIAKDFTQPLWLTVRPPAGAAAGEYAGQVRVCAWGQAPAVLELRVTVHRATLAAGAGHFRTSFDLLPGFLEQNYGNPLPRQMARKYGEFLLEHRLNPDSFSRSEPPELADLEHYQGLGLNSFCVINLAKHRGQSIRGGLNSEASWYTRENWEELARRVDPLVAQLRRRPELYRMAYVHGFDERDLETHGEAMKLFFGEAKRRWGLPTLTTSHLPSDAALMAEHQVDWLCPILAQYKFAYDLSKAQAARAAGLKVWSYLSLEPYSPYPNWRLDSPLTEARTLWWQAYQQRFDGFLYWGLNIWDRPGNGGIVQPRGPHVDFEICTGGDHDWLYGDGVLLYPGPDGPIGSIRLANIRAGLQDYELLWMLEQQRGVAAALEQCLPVAAGLDSFTQEPEVVLARREAILEMLE